VAVISLPFRARWPSKRKLLDPRRNGDFEEVCEAGAGCWSSARWSLGPPGHVCAGDPAVTSNAITFLTQNVTRGVERYVTARRSPGSGACFARPCWRRGTAHPAACSSSDTAASRALACRRNRNRWRRSGRPPYSCSPRRLATARSAMPDLGRWWPRSPHRHLAPRLVRMQPPLPLPRQVVRGGSLATGAAPDTRAA